MDRIAASEQFANSPRLCSLFIYLARRALQDPESSLSEQQVGVGVFNRPLGYDTASDTIVRVQASELRKRLKYYFLAEGKDEPTIMELPRGSYLPVFHDRDPGTTNGAGKKAELPTPIQVVQRSVVDPAPARSMELMKSPPSKRSTLLLFSVSSMLVVAILLCGWLAYENAQLRRRVPTATPLVRHFWTQFFQNGRSTEIIPPDFGATVVSDLQERTVSRQEYSDPNYASALLAPFLSGAKTNHYITRLLNRGSIEPSDLRALQNLSLLAERYQIPLQIISPREAQVDADSSGNVIILGHSRANPWVQLFESRMNFKYQFDDTTRKAMIINTSPRNAEKNVYSLSNGGENYAVAACLPEKMGTVLLLFGANMRSTQGAVDLVSAETGLAQLYSSLGIKPGDRIPYFEVLLEKKRAAQQYEIIASRVVAY